MVMSNSTSQEWCHASANYHLYLVVYACQYRRHSWYEKIVWHHVSAQMANVDEANSGLLVRQVLAIRR